MATREELEGELARRARARELEGEFARRAAAKAPAVPASQPRPRRAAPDPLVDLTLGGGPVPAERPTATVESLAGRATALREAGEVDKAALVEKQIDAMRARGQRIAESEARDTAGREALVKGREAASRANITARETDAPARPRVPVASAELDLALIPAPGSAGQALDVNELAGQRAEELSARRGLPVSETAALIEQERQQERERRARTVSAGGVVEEGPTPLLPILRPTRMQEAGEFQVPLADPVSVGMKYRDPTTGELREPTALEGFTEAFARQPVMSETDALAFALEQTDAPPEAKSALRNVLTQRVQGQGIVETPLGATLRAAGALTPAFINTALIGPLLSAAQGETTRTAPVAFGADPTAKRQVDETKGFLEQYARGIQQGRGIGDELAQITPLVKATAELAGENEEYARNALWATGTLSEIFLPVTPLGLPGKAAEATKLGAKAAGLGAKGVARIAPATAARVARVGEQVAEGARVGAEAVPALIRDRALLGTIAKRTFPDSAGLIPRLASEDEIVRILAAQGVAADEARTILRSQVPDNLVQISDSVAARKVVAADLLADAQAEVKALAPRSLTPEEVSRLVDNTLVAKARAGKPGLKLMDELTVRSLSPVPSGVEPGLFDDIVTRTFAGLVEDVSPGGAVRPDNALAAALYRRVQASTFRATQNLRDDIVDLARTVSKERPGLKPEQAKDLLVERVFDKYLATPDGLEKLVDKIVEDGLGRISGTDVKAAGRSVLAEITRRQTGAPAPTIQNALISMRQVASELGIALPKRPVDRLLPLMAATIIEDVLKPTVAGEKGSALTELARLQRARPARAGEVGTSSGAIISPRTTTGNAWATGAEQSFKPADMFEPEALNAAWTDSLDDALGKAGQLRKRFSLYTASQLGPIPNVPAWTDRFIRGALTSVAQIGYARTGAAVSDALRFRYAPDNAVLFTGADGIEWTKGLIKAEGRRVGLGLSAQDSARQGLANQVLIARVNQEVSGAARTALRAGAIGPDYAAMAGAASDAYREAVFAGALREGMTIDRAAQVARRSLIDYSLTPTGDFTDKITRYFASAAETWGGMTVLADALRRNPTAPLNVLRMQNGLNRTRDPLGVMGDESKRTVLSLPIGPNNYELLVGANPVVWALEGVLGAIGALDAGVVGVGEVLAGDQTVLDELSDVAGAGLRLAGGALLGELEPRTPTAKGPDAGGLTDTELLGLLLHLSAPDGQHPEWRPFIDANLPRKIVPPPKDAALSSIEGYKDLGALRLWTQIPRDWAKQGLVWERLSPEEAAIIVQQFPSLADSAPTLVRVFALEPEAKSLLRGLRGRSQGVFDDAARYIAAQKGGELEGAVGIPASTEDPTRIAIEAITRRGVTEPGEAERRAVEALRATRSGD